jgi:hypothetical protein
VEDEMNQAGGNLESGSGPGAWFHIMGRTVGAIVCTGFGAYSMYWWTVAVIQRGRTAWFFAIAALAAILLIWSIAELSALRRVPRLAVDKRYRRRYALGFNAILVIEVAAIILGNPILAHFHRQHLYPQWVNLVVGIHFLPLGKIFKMPVYYVTGLAISLFALGSLLFSPESLRLAVNAAGTGLTLWTTAVIILTKNLACLPAKSAFGASGSA